MKEKKTLVKADVKSVYLKNGVSEKVTYLSVPEDFYSYSVDEDVKKGAYHFEKIAALAKKEQLANIIAITADNVEMGLMAVTYLAFQFVEQRGSEGDLPFDSDRDSYFDEDSHSWFESSSKIPVLYENEISQYLRIGDSAFDNGGFMYSQAQIRKSHEPFWRSCTRESVCIVVNRESFCADNLDFVELFANNRRVYVIFLENGEIDTSDMSAPLPFGVLDKEQFWAIRNNFILSYAADEANVSFENHNPSAYYVNVLKQNFKQRHIKVRRGFSYERVVNLASSVNSKSVCRMIDKTIQYAIKDFSEKENIVLENKNFAFIDHFSRNPLSSNAAENGRELLEKNIVGIPEIKEQVYDVVNVMKYNKLRQQNNIPGGSYHNVHIMLGAPGTAKTTVARYMGQIMFDEKLLPDSRFICINGAELKGMYVGHSAPKTKALFEKYDVIIIDEAYSIVESGGATDSFGNEAIAQLIIELERHSTDKLVIFAGYGGNDVDEKDNRMKDFLDANPGIKSRITSTFYFKSYTADDMAEIFLRIAKVGNYDAPAETREIVRDYFAGRVDAPNFGNGREARALLENASLFAARRLMNSGKKTFTESELRRLTVEDITNAIDKSAESFDDRKCREKKIGFNAD